MHLVYRQPHFRILDDFQHLLEYKKLRYYASDLFDEQATNHEHHVQEAVKRAMQVCNTLNWPVSNHFKIVYKAFGEEIGIDYKMSVLGAYLVLMNGNPNLQQVAAFQKDVIVNFLRINAIGNN